MDSIQRSDSCSSFMTRSTKATIGVCHSLNGLPDELLIIILDRLPIENAVATSVLSRRWRNLWRHVCNIDFNPEWAAHRKNVLHYIGSFLNNYQGQKIQRFCVSLCYTTTMMLAISSWLLFVTRKGVEELSIDLNYQNYGRRYLSFHLPPFLHSCSTLVKLKLKFVELTTVPPPFPKSLKEVLFDEVILSKDAIEQITLNCPHLEMLSLSNCNRKFNLHVIIAPDSANIRLLIHEELKRVRRQTTMYISGSRIASVEFLSAMPRQKYEVDVESSVAAKFFLDKMSDGRQAMKVTSQGLLGKHYSDNLEMLLHKLRMVDLLVLSSWCIQVVGVYAIVYRDLEHIQANHLLLELGLNWRELIGVAHILAVCSWIKSLCIVVTKLPKDQELDWNDAFKRVHVDWFRSLLLEVQQPNRQYVGAAKELQFLETVEFRNYSGGYQMWDDWNFDEQRFFSGTESGSLVLKLVKRTAMNLNSIIFVSSKKRYVMNCGMCD